MRKISVLFTNNTLDVRAGSQTYVRDVALALLHRGHQPVAFSLVLGPLADELRSATVPVIDNLGRLGVSPDVIHGHHHLETLMAALTFPDVPIVHFCHGWVPWEELPLRHPAVRKYVAVDEVCLDRLVREEGILPERTEVLLNFVDLERFRPRAPLPPTPTRALVFSNEVTADGYARAIAAACAARGMPLDIVGLRHGNPTDAPEALLGAYDLVFAKGRAALEAMAVGCAVVLADRAGCGPLVTPDNFDRLRARNFGIRELNHAHDSAWYEQQIAAYRVDRAASVCSRVRAEAGMEAAVDRLLAIYTAAMAAPPAAGDASRAAAEHLQRLAAPLKQSRDLSLRVLELSHDLELARAEAAQNLAMALDHGRALQDQIAAYRALPVLRIRNAVLRLPLAGSLLRAGARALTHLLRL